MFIKFVLNYHVLGPDYLLESSFFFESEFRKSEFRESELFFDV